MQVLGKDKHTLLLLYDVYLQLSWHKVIFILKVHSIIHFLLSNNYRDKFPEPAVKAIV